MIDVHCHLTDDKYETIEEVLRVVSLAKTAGVDLITNGTGTEDSVKAIDLADSHGGIWACIGVAYETGYEDIEKTEAKLTSLCNAPKVVGIGESGLNYYRDMPDQLKSYQRDLFRMHIRLAIRFGLPIQIHNRGADRDIYDILEKEGKELKHRVLLHCFSASTEFMKLMAEWGCYFSFGGMITYKNNHQLRETLKAVPADRLILETDSPYLPPEPLRGSINNPINVKIVADTAAITRNVSVGEIERSTNSNARRLFFKMK